jgi:SAM-dependent methyltransferase
MSMPGLAAWLASPQGRYAIEWEVPRFDLMVADIFGYNAVQIGLPQLDLLRNNRMPYRFRSGPDGDVAVRGLETALPFGSASIDLILLPHGIEFSSHPHQVLREVERVLVPDGIVIVSGFNPFSLWGVRRLAARGQGAFPWQGQYLSVPRLKDWFALLGFETQAVEFGCYAPPMSQQKWLERWGFMDHAGDRWWSILGGTYILQAVKRVTGMRLILPNWRDSRSAAKALAPLAQRRGKAVQAVEEALHG